MAQQMRAAAAVVAVAAVLQLSSATRTLLDEATPDASGGNGNLLFNVATYTTKYVSGWPYIRGKPTDLTEVARMLHDALHTNNPQYKWAVWMIDELDPRYESASCHRGYAFRAVCDAIYSPDCDSQGAFVKENFLAVFGRVGWAILWTRAATPHVADMASARTEVERQLANCLRISAGAAPDMPGLAACIRTATDASVYSAKTYSYPGSKHEGSLYDPATIVDVRLDWRSVTPVYVPADLHLHIHVMPKLSLYH